MQRRGVVGFVARVVHYCSGSSSEKLFGDAKARRQSAAGKDAGVFLCSTSLTVFRSSFGRKRRY